MAGQLLLINPRKRHRRRMSAKQRRYFGGGRKRRHYSKRRRRNPIRIVRVHRRRHYSKRRHYSRARRRNPSFRSIGRGVMPKVKDAAIGAAGALAVDVIMGYASSMLPATLTNPVSATGGLNPLYTLTKGGLAVLLGTFGRKLIGANAERMAEGSLTVTLYNALKTFMPAGLTLGYMNPGFIGAETVSEQPAYLRGLSAYTHESAYMDGLAKYTD